MDEQQKDWFNSISRQDLLNYVIKLNDRELAKRQSTGITYWALIGAIGVIGYNGIELIPNLIDSDNRLALLFLIATLFNIAFSIQRIVFDIFDILIPHQLANLINLYKYTATVLMQILSYTMLFFLNVCVINSFSKFELFPYYFFSIMYFLIIVIYTGVTVVLTLFQTKFEDFPRNQYTSFWLYDIRAEFKFLVSSVFIFVSCYSLVNLDYTYFSKEKLNILKLAIDILCMYFLIVSLFFSYISQNENNYLQNIEKKLFNPDANSEYLKDIIRRYFITETQREWISKKDDIFKQTYKKYASDKVNVEDIDNFIIEIGDNINRLKIMMYLPKRLSNKIIKNYIEQWKKMIKDLEYLKNCKRISVKKTSTN